MPRRLLRFAFYALCLLSLLPCRGAGRLWRESYFRQPGVVWDYTTRVSDEGRYVEKWEFESYCNSGGLLVEVARYRYPFAVLRGIDPHHWPDQRQVDPWGSAGPDPYPVIEPNYRGSRMRDFIGAGGFQLCAVGLTDPSAYRGFAMVLPCWLLMAVTLVPPLWLALRARRALAGRRRRRPGLCGRCGYDLTGNTSGRCSECGEAVSADGRVPA